MLHPVVSICLHLEVGPESCQPWKTVYAISRKKEKELQRHNRSHGLGTLPEKGGRDCDGQLVRGDREPLYFSIELLLIVNISLLPPPHLPPHSTANTSPASSFYQHRFGYDNTFWNTLCLRFRSLDIFETAAAEPIPPSFRFEEASIVDLQRYDGTYRSVQQVNPDVFHIADSLDAERKAGEKRGPLHGIPILLKDNIATGDQMDTTAGSLALLDIRCHPPRDSFLAQRLRAHGAILLGKACMSEWANFRTLNGSAHTRYHDPDGWSGRCGQTANAYNTSTSPSGSSGGSAVAVALNFVTAALGTDTDASIVAPASVQALVGIRPSVGLTSRDLVIPISRSQDTIGPLARGVEDAAVLLDVLVGRDANDPATDLPPPPAEWWRNRQPYTSFLNQDIRGMRIGVPQRDIWFQILKRPEEQAVVNKAIETLGKLGAVIVENANITTSTEILGTSFGPKHPEFELLIRDFKRDLEQYLLQMPASCPIKRLSDVIEFNRKHSEQELAVFGQDVFELSDKTRFGDEEYWSLLLKVRKLGGGGIDDALQRHRLDAFVVPLNWNFFPPQPVAMAG
ncbi:uncharacterized protein VTP21DRAFT_9573 [Calcarisporiella thermophila]|uniref:uncharacterized protein n=1 Tax=Calcarisporiella thermophila TaxID=911321 RepID=UPI0037432616